jgi:hypothetical protein
MRRNVCPHCLHPVSVSDLRDEFLSLRRARAMTIGLSVTIGVCFSLGGWLVGYFLTPAAQRIGDSLATMLPFFAYVWGAPLL